MKRLTILQYILSIIVVACSTTNKNEKKKIFNSKYKSAVEESAVVDTTNWKFIQAENINFKVPMSWTTDTSKVYSYQDSSTHIATAYIRDSISYRALIVQRIQKDQTERFLGNNWFDLKLDDTLNINSEKVRVIVDDLTDTKFQEKRGLILLKNFKEYTYLVLITTPDTTFFNDINGMLMIYKTIKFIK